MSFPCFEGSHISVSPLPLMRRGGALTREDAQRDGSV